MVILSACIGILLFYLLQRKLYESFWRKGLSVSLAFSEKYVTEGNQVILTETLVNRKILPLPLIIIKFKTSRNLHFLDLENACITDHYYRNDVLSIMFYQKVTRTLPFVCSRRGYYVIDNTDVICNDIFLTQQMVYDNPCNISLYVYPKQIDTNEIGITFRELLGIIITKRFTNEDPFEFRNIREYQTYDTMKSINWKASAKTGLLKVNVHDSSASQQVQIIINLEPEGNWIEETLFETSIQLGATLSAKFLDQGIPVSIYSNGLDSITKQMINLPSSCGNHQMDKINQSLARISSSLTPFPFSTLCEEYLQNTSPNTFTLFISSNINPSVEDYLKTLCENKSDFHLFIPSYDYEKKNYVSFSNNTSIFYV